MPPGNSIAVSPPKLKIINMNPRTAKNIIQSSLVIFCPPYNVQFLVHSGYKIYPDRRRPRSNGKRPSLRLDKYVSVRQVKNHYGKPHRDASNCPSLPYAFSTFAFRTRPSIHRRFQAEVANFAGRVQTDWERRDLASLFPANFPRFLHLASLVLRYWFASKSLFSHAFPVAVRLFGFHRCLCASLVRGLVNGALWCVCSACLSVQFLNRLFDLFALRLND
jgi:hypothetical protein